MELTSHSASQYADLLEEAKNLQTRAQPLIDAYQSMIREEKDLEVRANRQLLNVIAGARTVF